LPDLTKHPSEVAPVVRFAQHIRVYNLHGAAMFSFIPWNKELLGIRSFHILHILETNLDTPASCGFAVETLS
jgi:hypothetical protein